MSHATRDGLRTKRATRAALKAAEERLGAFRAELVSRFGEPASLDQSQLNDVLPWFDGRSEVWGITEDRRLRFALGVVSRDEVGRIADRWNELAGEMRSAIVDSATWDSLSKLD